ncbi:hypothetical protein AALP_AAs75054U000100, partial [Arabis alpina]
METETPHVAENIDRTVMEKKVAMALGLFVWQPQRLAAASCGKMLFVCLVQGKKPRGLKNKTQKFNGTARKNTSRVPLSVVRQGAIAKRRSNFQGNQYPFATNFARKAASAPPFNVHGRGFNAGRMTSAANQS